MLNLEQLRSPSDQELDRFDLAAIDLACADGLPGADCLDVGSCLAWMDHAAEWVRQHTAIMFDHFAHRMETYDHSEGIFRIVALMSVLQRGLGVHYDPEYIAGLADFADSRQCFLHGIVEGHGGTCASLPVLYCAVGRRLGYPLQLVRTASHMFCRWDDPGGERFNIEINATGLNTHPDDYYLDWPVPIRDTAWREETCYLRSLGPRQALASVWAKRGFCLDANGRQGESVDAFATACSLVTDDRSLDRTFWRMLEQWRRSLSMRVPFGIPALRIDLPRRRRYPGLPLEVERKVLALSVFEVLLSEPVPASACMVR